MIQQAELSLTDADIVLFVTDGRTGVTPADEFMARWLKSRIGSNTNRDLQVILVANKCELSVNCYVSAQIKINLFFFLPHQRSQKRVRK